MSDALETIATMRAFCAEPHAPGTPAARLAEWLRDYLAHAADGVTLDKAFGLKPRRGQVPWWRAEQRRRQRAAGRQLVDAFGDSSSALQGVRRYAQGRGRHAPADAQYHDARLQAAHEYLRTAGGVPESERTLRRAAADSK